MKHKNKDQSVDTLPLLRIGNKTPMEGVTETKCGAETEAKIIQRDCLTLEYIYTHTHTHIYTHTHTHTHTYIYI